MKPVGHLIWRAFLIIVGLIFAAATAALATMLLMVPSGDELRHAGDPAHMVQRFMLVGVAGVYVMNALTGPAIAIVIALAEIRRIRGWLYYVVGGGLCGAAGMALWEPEMFGQQEIAIVLAAGFAAGLVYWAIAGRSAGLVRDPVPPPPEA